MNKWTGILLSVGLAVSGFAQTTLIWDGGEGGTGTDLNTAANWSGDAVPASTGAAAEGRHDATWNGSVAGPLSLSFGSAFGGAYGVGLVMKAGQTNSLTLLNSVATAQTLRIVSSTGATNGGIQIARGAGAFTIGAADSANPIQLVLGTGAGAQKYYFVNNSAKTAIIGENVTITKGGNHNASLIFSAGNWDVKGVIGALSVKANSGALSVTAGTVTLSGNNTGHGEVLVNGGTLKISAANNLGVGTKAVRLGQQKTSGTLEFTGANNTTISRPIRIGNGASAGESGSGTINNNGAGVLTFANATFNEVGNTAAGVNRTLTLGGTNTGDNTISGVIANNKPGLVSVIKKGSGKWILSGTNTYTGDTLVSQGTLIMNGCIGFVIGTNGVNNKVSGTGVFNALGSFTFDLTGASQTDGDSWTIVDAAALTETFGDSFTVVGFTDAGDGLWTKDIDGARYYQFSEADGVLKVMKSSKSVVVGSVEGNEILKIVESAT